MREPALTSFCNVPLREFCPSGFFCSVWCNILTLRVIVFHVFPHGRFPFPPNTTKLLFFPIKFTVHDCLMLDSYQNIKTTYSLTHTHTLTHSWGQTPLRHRGSLQSHTHSLLLLLTTKRLVGCTTTTEINQVYTWTYLMNDSYGQYEAAGGQPSTATPCGVPAVSHWVLIHTAKIF